MEEAARNSRRLVSMLNLQRIRLLKPGCCGNLELAMSSFEQAKTGILKWIRELRSLIDNLWQPCITKPWLHKLLNVLSVKPKVSQWLDIVQKEMLDLTEKQSQLRDRLVPVLRDDDPKSSKDEAKSVDDELVEVASCLRRFSRQISVLKDQTVETIIRLEV